MSRDKVAKFFIGFGIGTVIGGVVGLLFTPKSGEENRKLIAEKIEPVLKKIRK